MQALPQELSRLVLDFVPLPAQAATALCFGPPSVWRLGGRPRDLGWGRARSWSVRFFPGVDRLVAAGEPGEAVVWDILADRVLHRLGNRIPDGELLDVRVFPDGDRVIVISSGGTAVVWSAATGKPLVRLDHFAEYHHEVARVHPRGDLVVTAISDAWVVAALWNVTDGSILREIVQPGEPMQLAELSGCGRLFAVGQRRLYLWSTADGRLVGEAFGEFKTSAGVAITDGGNRVIVSDGPALLVWSIDSAQHLALDGLHDIDKLALLPCGRRLVVFAHEAAVVLDLATMEPLRTLDRSGGFYLRVQTIAVADDIVAACGSEPAWPWGQKTAIWDRRTGRQLTSMSRDMPPMLGIFDTPWPPCAVEVAARRSMSSLLAA